MEAVISMCINKNYWWEIQLNKTRYLNWVLSVTWKHWTPLLLMWRWMRHGTSSWLAHSPAEKIEKKPIKYYMMTRSLIMSTKLYLRKRYATLFKCTFSLFSPNSYISCIHQAYSSYFTYTWVGMISQNHLFVTLWTTANQAPLSIEFSRQEFESGLPCPPPGDLLNPGIKLGSPTLQADSLPSEPLGKSLLQH